MATANQLTEGTALQPFVLLCKNSKGKAAAALIQQALSAPNVYVFGELLEHPNIQQLAETEDAKYLELLKIFAYGTYADYKAKAASLPPLTPIQIKKLQQLTIVSLSTINKIIPYETLQKELDIAGLRELEDLIIDSVYGGLLDGKLDQRRKHLEVEFTIGRDIKPEQLDEMMAVLTQWSTQSESLLKTIKEKIQHANFINDQEKKTQGRLRKES